MDNNLVSEYKNRLKKLEKLRKQGINPYPSKSKQKNAVKEILEYFNIFVENQKTVIIAGRLRSKRGHGNLIFANLNNNGKQIQLAISKKEIGADEFKNLNKLIDIGDFIEVSGTCFVTHKGQNSIMVKNYKLLSKSLRPLPDKWHGLKDDEERFRKRYLDLLFNQELKDMFIRRSKFWDTTRQFMKKKGFFEVETPTLELSTGGAEAAPFQTHHDDYDLDLYLRISIGELWQKRLMAAGFEKTFEIGRVYRNEGSGPEHLQEFTNMEFYWAYANYRDGMKLTKELYRTLAKEVFGTYRFEAKGIKFDLSDEWKEIDYRDEILKQTGVDILKVNEKEMKAKLDKFKVKYEGDNKERLTDSLWKYCRKNIAGPAFLVNHPELVSPLAKKNENKPGTVERFQIIIAGSEVGNGYSELNDPEEQKARFELQKKLLEAGDSEAMMPDWEFVEMLEYGMPPTCGFGFGERLFAFMANKPSREITLFPLLKPKIIQKFDSSPTGK
ncbi:MAG: lysine--tRNA ligase [Patescibacteria group bacterium]|nr:lysine--tRNA ligase [Patescibacteria group bacterium]